MRSLRSARVRAPNFPAGTWFNTGDQATITLADLRGLPALLEFFTVGCVNCVHVMDELRTLEQRFGDSLRVIGIHSAKFDYEESDAAVAAAVQRYGLQHPVFNDARRSLWQQYAVRAWPTLVLLDEAGYVVAEAVGEGHVTALGDIVAELLDATAKPLDGTLSTPELRTHVSTAPSKHQAPVGLQFPAKAIAVGQQLVIANAGGHQLAVTDSTGARVRYRIGSAIPGLSATQFNQPNAVIAVPSTLVTKLGYDLLVADTGNHVLRGVRLADGTIAETIDLSAGLADARTIIGAVPAVLSPWDIAWWPAAERVVVAAAGVHLLLAWDPVTGQTEILAGTGVEGLKDGPAPDGWLAQPSGLAVDGNRLWFVDAETSALRWLGIDAQLHTAVGQGLFDFGFVDGPAVEARLQHPLALAVLPDRSVAIADTYNGAVRRYQPDTDVLSTLATGLLEPSGLILRKDQLLVIEAAAHRVTALGGPTLWEHSAAAGLITARTDRAEAIRQIACFGPGDLEIEVSVIAADEHDLPHCDGPASILSVQAMPPEVLVAGAGSSNTLRRTVTLAGEPGSTGSLMIGAQTSWCDDGAHPACHLAEQRWQVEFRVLDNGPSELRLIVRPEPADARLS